MKANTPPLRHRAWDGSMMHYRDFSSPYLKCDPRRLMFCTGVRDSMGAYIYEGDVIELRDHSLTRFYIDSVLWRGGENPSFDILNTDLIHDVNGIWAYSGPISSITVIGNIFEKPEFIRDLIELPRFSEMQDRFGASLKW